MADGPRLSTVTRSEPNPTAPQTRLFDQKSIDWREQTTGANAGLWFVSVQKTHLKSKGAFVVVVMQAAEISRSCHFGGYTLYIASRTSRVGRRQEAWPVFRGKLRPQGRAKPIDTELAQIFIEIAERRRERQRLDPG